MHVLVIGANGSIGRLAVKHALACGHSVRALVRSEMKGASIEVPETLPRPEILVGDLTREEDLARALEGIDAVIFCHGSSGIRLGMRDIDYGTVMRTLRALHGRRVRIVLMSAVSVTARGGMYNRLTGICDWKRRAERIVRASGLPYTIVRPGWFDCNGPTEHRLVWRHGDRFISGSPDDGRVSREQIASVLAAAVASASAVGKTFELVAEQGEDTLDREALFAAVPADVPGAEDAPGDRPNQPVSEEPESVRSELREAARLFSNP